MNAPVFSAMKVKDPYGDPRSLPSRMRRRRFTIVNDLIKRIIDQKGFCRILDIGGTADYWRLNSEFILANSDRVQITCANLGTLSHSQDGVIAFVTGDATCPELYAKHPCDLLHSNSVIEHVGDWTQIKAMADQIIASGHPFYLQTPNYWFPFEPHFRLVGYHWLPKSVRAKLLTGRKLGFMGPAADAAEAAGLVESIHLLNASQLRNLFPGATLMRERFGPLTKSFIVVKT